MCLNSCLPVSGNKARQSSRAGRRASTDSGGKSGGKMSCVRILLVVAMVLNAITSFANVFFRGKPVHGGTTANCPVDVMRLMWGNDDQNTRDRIQGQIQISKNVDEVRSLRIIVQGIDSTGAIIESYALTLERDWTTGRYKRYPILGIVFLKYDRKNRSQNVMDSWGRVMRTVDLHYDPELEKAWFYFDFSNKPDIKYFDIVNVVLNDTEVFYNLRLVGNRLPRTLSTMPSMKKSQRGNFSMTTEWLPPPTPVAESEFAKKTSNPHQTQKNTPQEPMALQCEEDEVSGSITYTAPVNWGLAVTGATFSFAPSVLVCSGKPTEMSFTLSGNTSIRLGYSMRLEKIIFVDLESKNLCAIDKSNSDNWPYFYLSSTIKEAKFKVPNECIHFLSKSKEIRCRLSFSISDTSSRKNYDFSFSKQQVSALEALVRQCMEKDVNQTSNPAFAPETIATTESID